MERFVTQALSMQLQFKTILSISLYLLVHTAVTKFEIKSLCRSQERRVSNKFHFYILVYQGRICIFTQIQIAVSSADLNKAKKKA